VLGHQQSFVLHTLEALGFIVNLTKSQLALSFRALYLGMTILTDIGIMMVPPHKRAALMECIQSALLAGPGGVTARQLASLKGRLLSMSWAFGHIVGFYTRSLDVAIASAPAWDSFVILNETVISDLRFWELCFDQFNGRREMWPDSSINTIIHTDAAGRSDVTVGGWGGWTTDAEAVLVAHGYWTAEETLTSSTWRELQAVLLALRSLVNVPNLVVGQSVQVVTDNTAVCSALNLGRSFAAPCVEVVKEIFWFSTHHNVVLSAVWVPRQDNATADEISKWVDRSDFQFAPECFAHLHEAWGPFSVDLFANANSAQLPTYFSRFYTPTSSGVDAFSQRWLGHCWAFPPFGLLNRFWRQVTSCGPVEITVVVPYWPTSSWWDRVQPYPGVTFASYVVAFEVFDPSPDLLVDWSSGEAAPAGPRLYPFLALRLAIGYGDAHTQPLPFPCQRLDPHGCGSSSGR
jgi:ribonuclease HI